MSINKLRGFTLIELMVSIAVLAIVLALALPSFQDSIEKRHLEGAASSIYSGLQLAKSESIKQDKDIVFDLTTGADWCYGIVDVAGATSCDCNSTDCTVNGQVVVTDGEEFTNSSVSSSGANVITFTSIGLPKSLGSNITFTVTVNGKTKTVSVNVAGLIKSN